MRATKGYGLLVPVLQVRVATQSVGLHLTCLSPDSAGEAEKREEDHDKPLSED
jgi:hypothetical protein